MFGTLVIFLSVKCLPFHCFAQLLLLNKDVVKFVYLGTNVITKEFEKIWHKTIA